MFEPCAEASKLLQRMRANKDGVVSFEYVAVAASVVAAVVAVFVASGSPAISSGLAGMLNVVTTAMSL
jgi:pilus assembly protein Flp/PilA